MKKKIAIIGAGASGLPAIKCCLDDDLEPTCFERTDDIGGLWNFKESPTPGQSSVMRSTIINTSKEMMCYSDFPIPKEFPNFMHNTKVLEYFRLYAKTFDLLKHIQFKTEVLKAYYNLLGYRTSRTDHLVTAAATAQVKQAVNFNETGKWDIDLVDHKTSEACTMTFDAVLLCTGHHAEKHMAHFEGEELFQGERMHTHEYRDHRGYEGKRIVVVGIGNSGGDVAVELGKVGGQVYLSTRRGSWVSNRIGDDGIPVDYQMLNHFVFDLKGLVPSWLANTLVERKLNQRFDHALYGLKPEHRFDAQHVTINDELPNRIASGAVVIKPNIKKITKTGVEFDDGTFEDNIDVIIYATGYKFGFPYVEHDALKVRNNEVNLFKYVFPPDVQPSTIGVIGCFQPLGAIMPISELQCRWATRVFKGERPLPPVDVMWADVRRKKEIMSKRYVTSARHTIQVDYVPFMDELAVLCGCKVDLWELFKKDRQLALSVYFGPTTPCQYRITGHGAWNGAREAIMTSKLRIEYPFKTRKVPSNQKINLVQLAIVAIIVLCIAYLVVFLFG